MRAADFVPQAGLTVDDGESVVRLTSPTANDGWHCVDVESGHADVVYFYLYDDDHELRVL